MQGWDSLGRESISVREGILEPHAPGFRPPALPLTTWRNLGTLSPCYSSLSDFICEMGIIPA